MHFRLLKLLYSRVQWVVSVHHRESTFEKGVSFYIREVELQGITRLEDTKDGFHFFSKITVSETMSTEMGVVFLLAKPSCQVFQWLINVPISV